MKIAALVQIATKNACQLTLYRFVQTNLHYDFEFKSQICMLMQVWLFSNDKLLRGIKQIPLKPFFTSQHSNA